LTRRTWSVIGILAAASSLLVSPPAARADPVDIVGDVRGRLRVRLLGIDSPETKKPRFSVGCWAALLWQHRIASRLAAEPQFPL
jgi:micrococcal nuclease